MSSLAPQQMRTGAPGALLAAAFALLIILSYVGPQAFAPLAGVAGLILLPWSLGVPFPRWRTAIGLLVLWAAATMIWAPAPLAPLRWDQHTLLKLALQAAIYPSLILVAARLSEPQARRTALVMAWGAFGLSVLLVIDALAGARGYLAMTRLAGLVVTPDIGLIKLAQNGCTLAVLFFAAREALRRVAHPSAPLVMIGALVCASLLLSADAPLLATTAGAAAYVVIRRYGRRGLGWIIRAVTLYWFATPLIVFAARAAGLLDLLAAHTPASWAARLHIWSFTVARIAEKPVLGWGLDASRAFPEGIPLHPHNGALQLWLELGLPGALIMAGLWALIFRAIARHIDERPAGAAVGTAVACLATGAVSYGLWQEWWLALQAFAAAACVLMFRWRGDNAAPLSGDR